MKTIYRALCVIGFLIVLFATLGFLGIGHFRLYYGPTTVVCEPTHAQE
jgi:hypothetical protein